MSLLKRIVCLAAILLVAAAAWAASQARPGTPAAAAEGGAGTVAGEAEPAMEYTLEPAEMTAPRGNLKLDYVAFMYGELANVGMMRDADYAISVLGRFPYLVCAEPGVLSREALAVTEAIKGRVKLFGYVNLGGKPLPDLKGIKAEVDRIAAQGWHGVFIDQFGYDFGETRARQNEIVDYAHARGLACFANGWFIDEVLGNKADPVHNPDGAAMRLGKGDWVLLESFLTAGDGYPRDIGAAMQKYAQARRYKDELGVSVACLSYQRRGTNFGQAGRDAELSYLTALLFGFDGWWFVDKLEADAFLYQPDPDLNAGDRLLKGLARVTDTRLVAETDSHVFILSLEGYPPPRLVVAAKKILPRN